MAYIMSKKAVFSVLLAIFAVTACDNKEDKPSKESVEKAQAEMEKKLQQTVEDNDPTTEITEPTDNQQTDEASQDVVEETSKAQSKIVTNINAVYKVGLYQFLDNTAVFTECASGKKFPVAFEGDNQMLQSTYLSLIPEAGQPLMVELKGEIAEREDVDGNDAQHLIPSEFIGVIHKGTCQ